MAQVDYIRFTSPLLQAKIEWLDAAKRLFTSESKHAKVMQFEGVRGRDVPWFVGSAEMQYKPYHLVQVSGRYADVFIDDILAQGLSMVNCTRIDFQRTQPYHDLDYSPTCDDLFDAVEEGSPDTYHSKIVGSDKTWTVYIGKRSSRKLTRIYIKLLDAPYLRVEFELKQELAMAAFHNLAEGRMTKDDLFDVLLRESEVYDLLTRFIGPGAKEATLTASKKPARMENRIKWIQGLSTTLERFYNDHDLQPYVLNLIEFLEYLKK